MTLTHDALLTLARKTEGAARDGDQPRVRTDARELLEALVAHIAAERDALARIDPRERRVLVSGQQHIIDLAIDLARADATGKGCACAAHARALLELLTVQADDERLRFGRAPRSSAKSTAMTASKGPMT